MSGIAGIFHCGTIKPVDPARIDRMCDALAHRGSAYAGAWTAPGVGLGCRGVTLVGRPGFEQPLRSADGRAVLVFDGAIDNVRELRRELTERGGEFRADGDGEVILAAWQRWGADCLPRLHGAFAFAVYDTKARTLLLARDRLGMKPLFMAPLSDGSLIFASELKGLLAHPLLRREPDLRAIDEYLAWGYVPDHRAILKGIEKLPAGNYRLLRHGGPPDASRRWWEVSFAERRRSSARDLEAELLHHLREALTSRMGTDVPPGALLSGKADSSSVVALMAESSRARVRTWSIGFDKVSGDETARAAHVAELLGTDHTSHRLGDRGLEAIDALVAMFDEPFADASALPAWELCRLARERVSVAISAEGADEVFAGYPRHVSQRHEDRLRTLIPAGLRRGVLGGLAGILPDGDRAPQAFSAKAALQALSGEGPKGYLRALSLLPSEHRRLLYTPDMARELAGFQAELPLIELMDSAPARSGLDRAQYADLAFGLPGNILTKLDRVGMAEGLEVRAPLLDHRLVEFAATLPDRMRVRRMQGQWLLKRAMRRYLPDDVLYRRTEEIVTPIGAWLRGPLAGEVRAIAASAPLARTGWFDTRRLKRMSETHLAGRADHSRLLWQLIMLNRSLVRLGVIS